MSQEYFEREKRNSGSDERFEEENSPRSQTESLADDLHDQSPESKWEMAIQNLLLLLSSQKVYQHAFDGISIRKINIF